MLTRVRFRGFRGFREFDATLRGVTAFLGPNSSGKTTALHAIRLACDALVIALDSDSPARLDGDEGDWIVVTSGTLVVDHARLLAVSDWRALFVDQDVGEGTSLSINLHFEGDDALEELEVRLDCARNEQLELTVRVRSVIAANSVRHFPKKSSQVNQRLTSYLKEHAPVAVFVPPFYGTVTNEEYRSRAVIDRLLGSGDQSHVVRNLVVGLEPAQFERLNAFLDDMLGARLTARTSPDQVQDVAKLSVQFRDTNGDLELSAAGAGFVNLVALYTALSRWRLESARRPVLFLLDEPEAHLHPRLQADSAERLARLITDEFHAQLLLATHSVDILNRLAALDAVLLRCDRAARDASVVPLDTHAQLFDDLAAWVDLTPYTAINFLASRRVVFCEGDDELAVLPRLAELKFRNNPKQREAFRRWSMIRLTGASNAPVAKLLAKLVANDVVSARAQQGGFKVVVVLDRDHERQPGFYEDQDRGVSQTRVVWQRHSLESLLVEPEVLSSWIVALLGDGAPADLAQRVAVAIGAANADTELNTTASDQLMSHLATSDLRDEAGIPLAGPQKLVHASRQARALIELQPEVWQRGKDRAQFILRHVRDSLPHEARRQFPTDVTRLIERGSLDRIGDPLKAIPLEVAKLLDLLAGS